MKRVNKLLCILLCVAIILPSFLPVNALEIEIAEPIAYATDEKIYCNASINQDFAGDAVLVVLDSTIGAINKVHDKSFFASVEIANIVDLTAMSNYETEKLHNEMLLQVTEESFRQILKLELVENSKENVLQVIDTLEQMEGIIYVGPDYLGATSELAITTSECSDELWALRKISIESAWDISTGSKRVRVGVIDSGIASHVDLNANVDTTIGHDFVTENSTATDDIVGHGTHVAGIIGAIGTNSLGISGVTRDITMISLQVTNNSGAPTLSGMIDAIAHAMNENIPIINFSISIEENSAALLCAIGNYPGLIVCAAGNQGRDIDVQPRYPAAYDCPNLITVANSNQSDTLHSGAVEPSNYGATTVHLAAPGTDIVSTFPGDGYATGIGTSASAPLVAGVAALIYSIRPDLTAAEIKNLILSNVDEVDALADKCITGGRLNAYKAVRAATEPQTFTGDVNGDERSDMILSRNVNGKRAITTYLGQSDGSFGDPITGQSSHNFVYTDPAFAGDFNGDGLTDIVVHWSNNYARQLLVYISSGNGHFYEAENLSSTRFHDYNQMPCQFFVADVNGDGCDDFVVHYRNTSGKRCALVYKGKSSAPYFSDATTDALVSTNTYYHNDPVYMGTSMATAARI